MGLIQTIKNKLGIGGVKVALQVPGQVSKEETKIDGKINLTSKSDQNVVSIEVTVFEEYTTGRGDDKKTSKIDLGKITLPGGFTMKAGESKEVPFSIDFVLAKSNNDDLVDKGGAMGAIGKMGKFANNEKSVYFVEADVDVKGTVLDPSDKKEFRLV